MTIELNGERYEHKGAGTVLALLQEIGAIPERVAVMVNEEVIPRAGRGSVTLKENDRVDVLSFCGGG